MNNRALLNVGRVVWLLAITGITLVGFFISGVVAHAASISISTTTANVTKVDNQTATTATTTAAVQQVLASITLGVDAVPADSETITVGDCLITFSAIGGSTADETDCTDDAATIDLDTGGGDTPRDESDIATVIAALTNVSDPDHGALAVTAPAATSTRFTGVASTTETTTIIFTDGTAGDIATTTQVYGVVGVIQVRTLTIGGTVEAGDVFFAVLPTVGNVSYTASSTDSTTSHIANGLHGAILASAGYAGQAFTVATSTNTIVFTGKATGTVFIVSSRATNASSTAQVSVITPASVTSGYTFTVTINGTDYTYESRNTNLKSVVEGLHEKLSAVSAITCTEDDTEITCTAVTPGTGFTIHATVTTTPSETSGGSNSSGSRTKKVESPMSISVTPLSSSGQPQTITNLRTQILALMPLAESLGIKLPQVLIDFANNATPNTPAQPVRDLKLNDQGTDVTALQNILISLALGEASSKLTTAGASGFFGTLTQAALVEYQAKNGIAPAAGYFGALTRAHMKSAGVNGIWW